jgi:hypothetical protein
MTNDDDVAREARSVSSQAAGRFQLPCFKCRAIAPEEVCDDRIFESSSLATCPARGVTLGVLLCSDQFNRYDPLVNKVADAIQSADGDEVAIAQAAIRVIAHHVERAYGARSTQDKAD